jgi:RimJ/RimL family protein N-acetyltransferase
VDVTSNCSISLAELGKNRSVSLAPLADDDYDLLSKWSSASSWAYAAGSVDYLGPEEFRALLHRIDDRFLMVRTRDGRPIGAVSWRVGDYPNSYVVGTMIGDAAMWGAGFGMEATLVVVGYLFDSKNAHRIEAKCGAFNKAAVQTFCSGLLRIEGILRDHYFVDGAYYDAVVGSILRDEYYSMTKPVETISAAEKQEAGAILEDYLRANPIESRKEQESV